MQIVFVGKISSNFFYYFRRIPIVLNQSFLKQKQKDEDIG